MLCSKKTSPATGRLETARVCARRSCHQPATWSLSFPLSSWEAEYHPLASLRADGHLTQAKGDSPQALCGAAP